MIETDFKVVAEEEIIDEVEETIVPTRPDIMPTRPDIMPKRPDIGPKRPNEVPSNPDPARDSQNPLDLFLDVSLDSPLDGAGGGGNSSQSARRNSGCSSPRLIGPLPADIWLSPAPASQTANQQAPADYPSVGEEKVG